MKACSRTTTPEHLLKAATELARALVAQEKFPLSEGVLCSGMWKELLLTGVHFRQVILWSRLYMNVNVLSILCYWRL